MWLVSAARLVHAPAPPVRARRLRRQAARAYGSPPPCVNPSASRACAAACGSACASEPRSSTAAADYGGGRPRHPDQARPRPGRRGAGLPPSAAGAPLASHAGLDRGRKPEVQPLRRGPDREGNVARAAGEAGAGEWSGAPRAAGSRAPWRWRGRSRSRAHRRATWRRCRSALDDPRAGRFAPDRGAWVRASSRRAMVSAPHPDPPAIGRGEPAGGRVHRSEGLKGGSSGAGTLGPTARPGRENPARTGSSASDDGREGDEGAGPERRRSAPRRRGRSPARTA